MPESRFPAGYHPRNAPYSLAQAAADNMLVVVTCKACRRCVHFLASDLILVLDGGRPAMDPSSRCKKCRTSDYMKIDLRQIHPGDIGKLIVHRPGKPRIVRDWRDVLF